MEGWWQRQQMVSMSLSAYLQERSLKGTNLNFLHLHGDSLSLFSSYVHFEGKVNPNNLIEVISLQPMNNNFDVGNYNAAVDLMTGKFSYLFA